MANIEIPSITELEKLLDQKTYDIYKNKLTCTINQADSNFATDLVSKYEINSVPEMSAFVAAIRPGFASLLNNFIERKSYSTGVDELDNILKDSYHYLMYQESIMKYLIWLGVKESESYDIIKKIAKKKFKEQELIDLKAKLKEGWVKQVGKIEGFDDTWQVVEDAAKYSFNASHSLSYAYDSLYGSYLKAHYPLEYYSVALNMYNGDSDRTPRLVEEMNYFNIKLRNPKFRRSRGEYFFNREENSIYKGIESIKYLNNQIGEYLYSLKDNKYNSFIELLIDLQGNIDTRQLNILIELDFFSEFGKSQKLESIVEVFNKVYTKKQFSMNKTDLPLDLLEKYAATRTKTLFKDVDKIGLLNAIADTIPDEHMPIQRRIKSWFENTGTCTLTDKSCPKNYAIVVDINTKYTPRVKLYNVNTGNTAEVKISKLIYTDNTPEVFDLIKLVNIEKKNKKRIIDGKWTNLPELENWLTTYYIQ